MDSVHDALFWSEFTSAASAFCLETSLQGTSSDVMVSSLLGEGMIKIVRFYSIIHIDTCLTLSRVVMTQRFC